MERGSQESLWYFEVPLSSMDHGSLDPSVGPGQLTTWIHTDWRDKLFAPALGYPALRPLLMLLED